MHLPHLFPTPTTTMPTEKDSTPIPPAALEHLRAAYQQAEAAKTRLDELVALCLQTLDFDPANPQVKIDLVNGFVVTLSA